MPKIYGGKVNPMRHSVDVKTCSNFTLVCFGLKLLIDYVAQITHHTELWHLYLIKVPKLSVVSYLSNIVNE